jgi:bacterioferritin-associated ferredoxin
MIRAAAAEGATSIADLRRATGCAGTCGSCAELAAELLAEACAAPARVPRVLQTQAA